jgi:hypothetical protein
VRLLLNGSIVEWTSMSQPGHDDDEWLLPASPTQEETELVRALGPNGLKAVDDAIVKATQRRWLKVARIVTDAIEAGGFSIAEDQLDLHVRRIIALVKVGTLESQGNLRRPLFSEVRLPPGPG